MRSIGKVAGAALMAAGAVLGCGPVLPAQATPAESALNGTYRATSDGEWAKLNQQFHDVETVKSIWTIKTTCASGMDCTGTVTSDQGWSAPITLNFNQWLVVHQVEGWMRCSDGSIVNGHQTFKFGRVHRDYYWAKVAVGDLQGFDEVMGPSGGCGNNQWLYVEQPFYLEKLS